MWLKTLTLKNFQKHESLTLDFTSGVNYIYGPSDAGKSCIRRAIGFLFFGEPRADAIIRKEGTKQTSVVGLLDNGTEVERIKSATINRYVVRVPGQKEQTYDSIGATIPDEVRQVLQVQGVEIDKDCLNLNMAEQISMPFLTDVPGSYRLKLFNKLTGNDLLDKVVQNLNREILGIGRDLKVEHDVVAMNQPLIGKLESDIQAKKVVHDKFVEKFKTLNDKAKKLKRLEDLYTQIESNRTSLKATEDAVGNIKTIDDTRITALKARLVTLDALDKLRSALTLNQEGITVAQDTLGTIKTPSVNLDETRAKINRLKILEDLQKKLISNSQEQVSKKDELIQAETTAMTASHEYKTKLAELKICPTCKTQMTEEHLAHVEL